MFVGNPSARVRDELWRRAVKGSKDTGWLLQVWSDRNPQGYSYRQHGRSDRTFVDFEGVALVTIKPSRLRLEGFDTDEV